MSDNLPWVNIQCALIQLPNWLEFEKVDSTDHESRENSLFRRGALLIEVTVFLYTQASYSLMTMRFLGFNLKVFSYRKKKKKTWLVTHKSFNLYGTRKEHYHTSDQCSGFRANFPRAFSRFSSWFVVKCSNLAKWWKATTISMIALALIFSSGPVYS